MSERRIYRPPWRIDLTVRDRVPSPLGGVALAGAMAAALDAAGAPRPASVGLILTDDRELAELNATHMGKAGPTDVLSFPLLPPESYPRHAGGSAPVGGSSATRGSASAAAARSMAAGFALPPGARLHLGDIVVSVERAIDQAEAGRGGQTGDVRWEPADELRLLVTHGVLHICGWDHAEPAEEAAMRALEARLLGGQTAPR